MKKNLNQIPFDKAFLTSLFLGVIATMACFIFDIWYRSATNYDPSDFINVSSIIFIVNLLLLVAGVAYYALKSWSKSGDLLFILFFGLLIAFCIWKTIGIHRFAELNLNREFIQLLGGTIIIIGIAILCIPYCYGNRKIVDLFYDTDV